MEVREFFVQKPLPVLGKTAKLTLTVLLREEEPQTKPSPAVRISVVIPAHNEERYLGRTLASLQRQNYGWFETIVVANGCTDLTVEVARERCDRLVELSEKSLGIARNLGARLAKGELLVFLDADTALEAVALRRIAEVFNRNHAAGTLCGRPNCTQTKYRLIYAAKNFLHRWSLHPGSSGVIICWKDQFEYIGGFDEDLAVRENSELIHRLKRFGKYRFIGDVSATNSMRRYEKRGFGKVLWLWLKLWLESIFGDLRRQTYEPVR
jgi:glycosyltransferase involved in cell wall biosynthesis